MIQYDVQLARGICPVQAFGELDDAARPIVLFFMDGFGPRPMLFGMAQRLADQGHRVLLPDLFYDHLPAEPLSAASVLSGGADRDRMNMMLAKLDQAAVDADVGGLIAFCETALAGQAPIGATGYCMGGRYALTAATLSTRVVFAASFHGATLAPESGDGVDQRLQQAGARVYIGIAGIDPMFGAAEEGRLAEALRGANLDHVLETYAGAYHGFAMADLPMHHEAARMRHWQRLADGLAESFAGAI
jgi:carboxymethylenebutenolidase